ncbi:MAG: serine/threonine protein phosphatase [Opitutales bacterium]
MDIKDTKQARVRIAFDGRVTKEFVGPMAFERFDNERRILRFLEQKNCPFVPRVLDDNPDIPALVTSNCGQIVDKINPDKLKALFAELESYGVRHEDPYPRNVTYSPQLGRFCLIDFEFATNLETGEGLVVAQVEQYRRQSQRSDLTE